MFFLCQRRSQQIEDYFVHEFRGSYAQFRPHIPVFPSLFLIHSTIFVLTDPIYMNPKREDRIAISMGLSCKGRKGSHVNRIPVKMTISFDSSPLLGHKLLFQSNKSHSQPQFPDFIWIKLGFTTQLKHKLLPSFCFVCTISSSPPLFGREGVSSIHAHPSFVLSRWFSGYLSSIQIPPCSFLGLLFSHSSLHTLRF